MNMKMLFGHLGHRGKKSWASSPLTQGIIPTSD